MSTLVALSHHRWSLPVLAELGRTRGSRFATLTGRLGVSGESLRRTLAYLQAEGLVERNEGYGHPLRPEYLLTAEGRAVAPNAQHLLEALAGHEHVGLKKWSLPVLAELTELEEAGLVRRTVTDDRPPRTSYEATDRRLVQSVSRIARGSGQ